MGPASPLLSICRCSVVSRSFLRRRLPDGTCLRGLHLDTTCAPPVTWQLRRSGTKARSVNRKCPRFQGNATCDLAIFEPLRISESRLANARGVATKDLDFLHHRIADLTKEFEHLDFALPVGPIHGDAHTKNLLTDRGQVVLIDFEAAAIGPREWDLLPTSIAVQRYGLPEQRYQEFAATYGFDVRTWPGYPVLREIREVTMTTWIMQNVLESKAIADEFALRVACLREKDSERAWHFF